MEKFAIILVFANNINYALVYLLGLTYEIKNLR